MDPKDIVLGIIYNLVKNDSDPITFPCTYRDIILKSSFDIIELQRHLDQLTIEGLVISKKLDRQVFCITNEGLDKANQMQRNAVVDSDDFY